MNSQNFIIEKIEEIMSKPIKLKMIRYGYDAETEFHIIEISPKYIRFKNKEYIEWEKQLWTDFSKHFPYEDMIITEPLNSIEIGHLLYEFNKQNKSFIENRKMALHSNKLLPINNMSYAWG